MRSGIFKDINGVRTFDVLKIIGKYYGDFFFTNSRNIRYRFLKGSRSSKKSVICAYETLFRILENPEVNVLWCRWQDQDLRNSCYAAIVKAINDLGLNSFFKCTTSPLMITYTPTGQVILFRGLANVTSMTSLSTNVGYLGAIYLEEAYEIAEGNPEAGKDIFDKLDQSLRIGLEYDENGELVERKNISQQITCLFNSWSENTFLYEYFYKGLLEDDPEYLEENIYQEYYDENYVGGYGTGILLMTLTYRINEFRQKKQVDVAAEEMKKKNPDYYKTIFLGCWGNASAGVYPEFNSSCVITDTERRNDDKYRIIDWAIGIDTGYSDGTGHKTKVNKNEDGLKKIKSATAVTLIGVTEGWNKLIAIDELYQSNIPEAFQYNTVVKDSLNVDQIATLIVQTIQSWIEKYSSGTRRNDMLCKGNIKIYVDSADIATRQILELKCREYGLFNVMLMPSTKTAITGRIDLERLMLSYGDLIIQENCPNLIREFKSSRYNNKKEREDSDDHCLTSFEYGGLAPFKNNMIKYKSLFKDRIN